MSKLFVQKIQILSVILALIIVSMACNIPDVETAVSEPEDKIVESMVDDAFHSDCTTADRSQYEQAVNTLGGKPETPKYPEGATYYVCYGSEGLYRAYMIDGNKPAGNDETDNVLTGTYSGEPPTPLAIQAAQQDPNISNLTIDVNTVTIIVEADGRTHGEKILKYSYTAIGENDEPVAITSSWRVTFAGTLLEPPYQLNATLDYHFVSSEQDDQVTRDMVYDIQISGNIMRGTPTEGEFDPDENNLDMLIFEATKQ